MCEKKCKKCDQVKPLDAFYKNKNNKDGYAGSCAECMKAKSAKYRRENPDKVKASYSRWVEENKESRKEYCKRYHSENRDELNAKKREARESDPEKTKADKNKYRQENRDVYNAYQREYRKRNKIKLAAHELVKGAVKKGLLVYPKECSECGSIAKIYAHHDSYFEPLNVRFLCGKCHSEWHKNNKAIGA